MAGVTDVAFRTLGKRYGAGLTYTEFVNSTSIVRGNKKAATMLQTSTEEQPVAVQLFGNSIQDIIQAAQHLEKKFDIIDINCGCPAWKVIKTGAGSALLKQPEAIGNFVNKLVTAINRPVTVKIRAGINDRTINAVEVAKIVEDAGAAAIAIHGRTQEQGYSGQANWNIIKDVKDNVHIPVIGNGDVFTPELFQQRLEETNVDYIMIARGALGNPYIFTQIQDYLKKGSYDKKDPRKQFEEYLQLAQTYNLSFNIIKSQALTFTKGIIGGAKLRETLTQARTIEQLQQLMS